VHRGGQYFPFMFAISMLVLLINVMPLICLIWWGQGSGRLPDDGLPSWMVDERDASGIEG
jgi:hypothetical protein